MKNLNILLISICLLLTNKVTLAQWTTSGSDIYFTGKVGIGSISPATPLHLRNSAPTLLTLERTSSTFNVSVEYKNDTTSVFAGLDAHGGFTIARTNNMLASSMITAMANGNVGIGTSSPAEKLSVNGKIRSHEIKVETAGWPDYVFEKNYQLPSLEETERYIKEKGHLQDIPSAGEVKSDGVNLGEINAKLLKKIEELTLHMIQQKKDYDSQAALIKQMQERLMKLENTKKQE